MKRINQALGVFAVSASLLSGCVSPVKPVETEPEVVSPVEAAAKAAAADPRLKEALNTYTILIIYGCMEKLHIDPEKYWSADEIPSSPELTKCLDLQNEFILSDVFSVTRSGKSSEQYGNELLNHAMKFVTFYSDKAKASDPAEIILWANRQGKLAFPEH